MNATGFRAARRRLEKEAEIVKAAGAGEVHTHILSGDSPTTWKPT